MRVDLKALRPTAQQTKLFIVIVIIFVALFGVIREYNLDRTQPSQRYFYHVIPIALSVLYFHWPYDYTGSAAVESGYTTRGLQYVLNHRDEFRNDKRVYYWTADDRGALDMTVAGFYLFGPKITSMAYFYVLVLAATVIVFCLSHRDSAPALGTLAISLLSLGVCFGIWNDINKQGGSSPGFDEGTINLSESRFFGLLAFFPILSLYFVVVQKTPLTFWQWAGGVFQTLLYAEVLHARMSVLWLAPPLGLIACAGVFSRRISPMRRNAYTTIALIFLALISKSALEHTFFNPAYYADRGNRTIWHNVLMGLAFNPFFEKELGTQLTDPVAARLVLRFEKSGEVTLRDQHLSGDQLQAVEADATTAMNSLGNYGTFGWPSYERAARSYVSAVFRTYPMQFVDTYIWYKPISTIRDIGLLFLPHIITRSRAAGLPMLYPTCLVLLIVLTAARYSFSTSFPTSHHRTFCVFMGLCLIFSFAIPIGFYPAPTQLGDSILVMLIWGFSVVYRLVLPRTIREASTPNEV